MIQNFNKIKKISGTLILPGDKSISHRSVMFSSLAEGKSQIYNCLMSEDIHRTINAFREMGCEIEITDEKIIVNGKGISGLQKPDKELYMGNSGTTTRLITGILAAQNFETILTGDKSLSGRDMKRVIDPLTEMGAKISSNDGLLPIVINPIDSIIPMEYKLPIASAQIKSCVLLAGLFNDKETVVIENKKSRNHTEKMLNLKVEEEGESRKIFSSNKDFPKAAIYNVPSDISTAAFFIILTLLSKKSELLLPNISLNETRTGILTVLKNMRGNIEIQNEEILNGEKRGDIVVKSSQLKNIEIPAEIIPNIIDEIPILSIAGLFAEGDFSIRNAKELRHKESDRIKSVCDNLKLVGINVEEFEDGYSLSGIPNNSKVTFESNDDHRITMAFAVLSSVLKQGGSINDFECANISNPNFLSQLEQISS